MKKEDVFAVIQKEIETNPQISNAEIAKNNKIPFKVVKLFRKIIGK